MDRMGYAVSSVSSAIDVAAARDGVRYIPAHEILARKGATLGIPVQGKLLIPDQLFALDYGGSYRAFLLEVDRGTEPLSSKAARKSYASSIAQYAEVLRHGQHRDHYGLKANLLVLWVFTSRVRAQRFLELVRPLPDDVSGRMLVNAVDGFGANVGPAEVPTRLFAERWQTGSGSLVSIAC